MWWRTFYDPSEPDYFFRRNSMGGFWTLGWLLALCALLAILGAPAIPYLALPVAFCGSYVFLSYLTGIVGMAVFTPILAFGWLCLGWIITFGFDSVGSTLALLEALMIALCIVNFLIGPSHVRAKLYIPVIAEGFFYACVAWGVFWLIAPNPEFRAHYDQLNALLHRMMDFYFLGVNAVSAIVLAITIFAFLRGLPSHPKARRQLAWDVVLLAAGFVVTLVAALASRVHPLVGIAALLVGYAAITLVARAKEIEQVGWALAPFVFLGTLAILATVPLDYLPDYKLGAQLMRSIQNGALGTFAQATMTPLLAGLAATLGGLVSQAALIGQHLHSLLGSYTMGVLEPLALWFAGVQRNGFGNQNYVDVSSSAVQSQLNQSAGRLVWQVTDLPQESQLMQLLCLYLAVFVICCVMGTLIGKRTRLVADGSAQSEDAGADAEEPLTLALPTWFRHGFRREKGSETVVEAHEPHAGTGTEGGTEAQSEPEPETATVAAHEPQPDPDHTADR